MKWLVFIHVAAAIIGIGPTFFMHVCFRKKQTVGELKQSFSVMNYLMPFPKIVGTIAVLSGILLVILTGWQFADFWIWGSLAVYVATQIMVIGVATPAMNKANAALSALKSADSEALPSYLQSAVQRINKYLYLISTFALLIILMMVIKPMF